MLPRAETSSKPTPPSMATCTSRNVAVRAWCACIQLVQPVQAPSRDGREAQEQHTGEERLVWQLPEQAIKQVQGSKRDESQAQFWQAQTWQQTQEGEPPPCEVRDHFRSVLIEGCPEEDG